MKLARFLLGASRRMVALIAVGGIINGLCGIGLIAIINQTLNHPSAWPGALALAFLGLMLGKLVSFGLSQIMLVRFAQDTLLTLCDRLCRSVATTPYRQLERIGIPRILTILTDDITTLSFAIQSLPALMMNGAVLIGCGVYLAWLSWATFLGMLALVILGALSYRVFLTRAQVNIRRSRDGRDTLFRHFRSLTEGIKELKLHRGRREIFFSRDIATTIGELRRHNLSATKWYILADSCSNAFFYVLIGLLLFVVPMVGRLPVESLTGYIFAALYLVGPVWGIIGALPTLNRGQISLQKIEECDLSLTTTAPTVDRPVAHESPQGLRCLEVEGAVFAYEPEGPGNGNFVLGPIDFVLHPREVVFLVGGNGSGKSTFVKLLTGLYVPQAGEIRLDGKRISDENREWYRQHFSAVFSDFYLFDDLLGLAGPDLEVQARTYLARLQLDRKIEITNGRFSSTALSQGQRKRLALLTAYLEDRPIYVFDEWAADQDPAYKEIFYRQLVPDLRRRGKAIVVITHDDRYFSLGDRVIRLEEGRVAAPGVVCPSPLPSSEAAMGALLP